MPHLPCHARLVAAVTVTVMLALPAAAEPVLRRGNDGEAESLDPHKVAGAWEDRIIGDLFEGLLADDPAARPIPGQASSWTVSDDGLVYTFTLRPDARWSDGRPVTAGDFVYAFRRLLAPATAAKYASLLFTIAGAEAFNSGTVTDPEAVAARARGPRTLEVRLAHPAPYFLDQLTHMTAYPVPRHVVDAHGDDWTKPGNIVTNGPYRLVDWQPQRAVTLTRNDAHYAAAEVAIATVVYLPIEDRTEALKRFRADEIDTYPQFPARQYRWLRANLPDETRVAPYLGIYYYPINIHRPPFDRREVRRALALAIDREIITERITGVGEVPATSFVPPGTLNYRPAFEPALGWPAERRLAKARRLLAAAGYGPETPLRFVLRYNTSENHRQVAIAIAAMWKQALGVEVELFNSEVTVHYNALQHQDFEVARAAWIADYNDAQNFLFLAESSSGKLNYPRYANPDYDRLMDQAALTQDPAARGELLHQAEAILMHDMPYIPIYYYVSRNLVSTRIKGWVDNIEDRHRSRWLSLE